MAGNVAKKVQRNVKRALARSLGISRERVRKVDTAWLRMDYDTDQKMIVGVWQLAPGIKNAAVCERIEPRNGRWMRPRVLRRWRAPQGLTTLRTLRGLARQDDQRG